MDFKSIKKNRKVIVALLACTGFMSGFPLVTYAKDNTVSVQSINQQSITIKGTVSDPNGDSIIGASVFEKGKTVTEQLPTWMGILHSMFLLVQRLPLLT